MKTTLVVAVTLGAALFAQQPYTAARYAAGAVPGLAPMALGGGQAIVELTVGVDGSVVRLRTLRSTPPFTDMLLDSVSGWRFSPATDDPIGKDGTPMGPRNVSSKVIVAALYRAPVLQGPSHGEAPKNVAGASRDVAYPSSMPQPLFPPAAQYGGVVMIEARVNASGVVADAQVIASAPPFDEPAMNAARRWRFRPAGVRANADTYAYLIFGFPQPVTRN